MKSFSMTFDRIATASAILLGLALLLFPCVAEARVHINIPPQGNPQYEEPQRGTMHNVVIPEQDDELGAGAEDEGIGFDDAIEALLMALQMTFLAPAFAPAILFFDFIREGGEAFDSDQQQVATLKRLLKCQEKIRAKKRALSIFISLMLLFTLSFILTLIDLLPFLSTLPFAIALCILIVLVPWYFFGSVVIAALPAQGYYEKRLNPIKSK